MLGEHERVTQQPWGTRVLRQVDVQVGGLEGELFVRSGIVASILRRSGSKVSGQLVSLFLQGPTWLIRSIAGDIS